MILEVLLNNLCGVIVKSVIANIECHINLNQKMIPQKAKEYIEEYISQEVYVQIAIIKGKQKISTEVAIDKYLNTNHFKDFSEGKPYNHFIDGLKD